MSRRIDYYFSFQSPWAYIGHQSLRRLVETYALELSYKPVLLGELFSETGGLPLAKRHPARQLYRAVELQRWRDKRGLDFKLWPKHWPFDARLADGVVIAALADGLDPEPYLQRAYAAVWERELDLTQKAVLTELANAAGLPGERLVAQAGSDQIRAAYEQNRLDAIAANVFGSPAYVLDGEVFWGQDRIELLEDALKSGREPYRPVDRAPI
ncbi:2-hydroxychromene-2-carboxylate isomerase [Rhodopseudomonas palustris]|uniref:2-hydroxychromene-2-carboxylate isomerase n=1 Tax=Rhodopseudomonas palustris TaxID=1076 RepID=A0A323UIS4_RHOPL|nr:2-hydroxychromene-2-carboxylate isomerase [Rhodopseudomonas palustris]PZA11470.1 2-hydroxychromene-2-carboxylate isomerase [Rhodopseudomonas palustris]